MLMLLSKNWKSIIFLTVMNTNDIASDSSRLPSVSFGLDKLAILEDKYGNGDNPDIGCM